MGRRDASLIVPSPPKLGSVARLASSNVIRIDYSDTTRTQRYLHGTTVTTGAWHTIRVRHR